MNKVVYEEKVEKPIVIPLFIARVKSETDISKNPSNKNQKISIFPN